MRLVIAALAAACLPIALGACSSGASAMLATAWDRNGSRQAASSDSARSVRPEYRYLRATVDGRVALLVLGYIDRDTSGPIEVWYSAKGEVVRLRDGRLAGTTGLSTDWRAVRDAGLPPWNWNTPPAGVSRFERARDLMPGYRANVHDVVEREAIAPPAHTHLAGRAAAGLRWFEERTTTVPASEALPPSRFALALGSGGTGPEVVYSEQCVSPDLCLSLEQWSGTVPIPPRDVP